MKKNKHFYNCQFLCRVLTISLLLSHIAQHRSVFAQTTNADSSQTSQSAHSILNWFRGRAQSAPTTSSTIQPSTELKQEIENEKQKEVAARNQEIEEKLTIDLGEVSFDEPETNSLKMHIDVTGVEKIFVQPISETKPTPLTNIPTTHLATVTPKQSDEPKVVVEEKVRLIKELMAPLTEQTELPPTFYPTIITASRLEEPIHHVGRSVTVVTAEDMEAKGSYTLTEALRNIPGVRVRTQGQVGDIASLSIRGSNSYDTLVLIEGMPLRDIAGPQGSANSFIGNLFTDNFKQIEVMRGSGSTLYGSEAVGGVVHLRMKEGEVGRPKFKAIYDAGSYATHRQTYQVSGGLKGFDYFMSYGNVNTNGIRTKDAYNGHIFGGNWGFKWEDTLELRFMVNAANSNIDLNNGSSLTLTNEIIQDSSNETKEMRSRFVHYNGFLRHKFTDHFEHTLRLGFVDSDRRDLDFSPMAFSQDGQFDGLISNVEYQANLYLGKHLSLVTGLEHEREEYTQINAIEEKEQLALYRFGWFVENRLSFFDEALNITGGGRLSHHEKTHTLQSGELSGSYLFRPTQTRIKGHFGTGFREPSAYELIGFSPQFGKLGNPDLKPEKSINWEIGLVQELFKGAVNIGATFFKNEYSKRIILSPTTFNYARVDGGYSEGLELETSAKLTDNLSISGSFTRTLGERDAESLILIPRNQFGLSLDWKLFDRLNFHADLFHYGNQQAVLYDSAFARNVIKQNDFTKLNLKLGYEINDHFEFWIRSNNVLGSEVLENGFRTPGAEFFGGASLEI